MLLQFSSATPVGVSPDERWITIGRTNPGIALSQLGLAQVKNIKEHTDFNHFEWFGYDLQDINWRDKHWKELTIGYYSPKLFSMLGVRNQFNQKININSSDNQIYLSASFWKKYFGQNVSALGEPIEIGGKLKLPIADVLADGFNGLSRRKIDLWLPYQTRKDLLEVDVPGMPSAMVEQLRNVVAQKQPYYYVIAKLEDLSSLADTTKKIIASDEISGATYSGKVSVHRGITLDPEWLDSIHILLTLLFILLLLIFLLISSTLLTALMEQFSQRVTEFKLKSHLGASQRRLLYELVVGNIILFSIGPIFATALGVLAFSWLIDIGNTILPSKAILFSQVHIFKLSMLLIFTLSLVIIIVANSVLTTQLGTSTQAKIHTKIIKLFLAPATLVTYGVSVAIVIICTGHVYVNYIKLSETNLAAQDELSLVTLNYDTNLRSISNTPYSLFQDILQTLVEDGVLKEAAIYAHSPITPADIKVSVDILGSSVTSMKTTLVETSSPLASLAQKLLVGTYSTESDKTVAVNEEFVKRVKLSANEVLGKTINFDYLGEKSYEISGVIINHKLSQHQLITPQIFVANLPVLGDKFFMVIRHNKMNLTKLLNDNLSLLNQDDIKVSEVIKWKAAIERIYFFESRVAQVSLLVAIGLVIICGIGYFSVIRTKSNQISKELAIHETLGANRWQLYIIIGKTCYLEFVVALIIVASTSTIVVNLMIPFLKQVTKPNFLIITLALVSLVLILLIATIQALVKREYITLREALTKST